MSQIQEQQSKIDYFKEQLNHAISEGKISNWEIHRVDKKRNNIYVERDYRIESLLNSSRSEILFNVYKDFGEEVGESGFSLNENNTPEDFDKELEDAIFICSHGKSKTYSLPSKDDEIIGDSSIDYSSFYDDKFFEEFSKKTLNIFIAEKLNVFRKLIESHQSDTLRLTLNSFEFHNTVFEDTLETSKEISKSYKKNSSYMEFVLTTYNPQTSNETEHIVYEKINDLFSFDFEKYFNKAIVYAKDTALAKESRSFEGIVLLNETATLDFFTPDLAMNSVIAHCSSKLKYQEISEYEQGKEVLRANKDKLTIYSNPLRPKNVASTPFDTSGITAQKLCLIEEGKFKNFFASKKYADYLNITPTGPVGVIEVEAGSQQESQLREEDEYIEIISFSSFVPDTISGDFSAEIRLGYHVRNGKKIPFKGGLFSGNIFKLCEDIELSKEVVEEAGYFGPRVLKLYKGEITGL